MNMAIQDKYRLYMEFDVHVNIYIVNISLNICLVVLSSSQCILGL